MRLKPFMLTTALAALVLTGCNNDDDGQPVLPGTIGVTTSLDSYQEDEGTISVTFTTSTAFDKDVTIAYETTGTSTAGEDYETLSGMVTLTAGETNTVQNLILLDDDTVEASEQLILTIVTIDGSNELIGSNSTITLTITDNDSFPFENGILVLHEGNFGAGNASVSFVPDDLSAVRNNIFKTSNAVDVWGDTAQRMTFNGNYAYIVVNNSQKIEVVDRYTFKSVATIGGPGEPDFLNPRDMVIVNNKGYVTNWGDGSDPGDDFVSVINLENNTVESQIPVEEGPEAIIANESTIYVAHQGGFGQNNIVSVINAMSNEVTTTVMVADRPNSLQLDADGNLWVLSGGNPAWTGNETAGQLDKISIADNTVTETLTFALAEHPGALSLDGDNLYYYLSGSVFKMERSAAELPVTADLTGLSFYNMTINEGKLYGVDAKDFTSNGSLEVYDLGDNTLLASKEVAIIPTGVYFNAGFEL